jgi:hypothetical protein
MTPAQAADYVARMGVLPALHVGVHKSVNQLLDFTVLKGMTLRLADIASPYLNARIRYDCGFLDESALYRLSLDWDHEMSIEFIEQALERGDQCYGIVDDGKLASYGWYAHQPTAINDDLVLSFDSDYVYMYKAFTHPDYRGQRLAGIGMAKAVEAFTRQGKKGIIAQVESHDHLTLHSCDRLGCQTFGSILILGHGGHYVTYRSPRCKQYHFEVTSAD